MSWRPKWQNFGNRDWEEIRGSWLNHIPTFPDVGSLPDPGLEKLLPLRALQLPDNHGKFQDVAGLRTNALWEAVCLFHKCAHTNLAVHRIGQHGMHSWGLFNAYHSAYLGARGIMAILGVAMPKVNGNQIAIDLFPELPKKRKPGLNAVPEFQEFVVVRLSMLEQRFLWEAFQRVLNMTQAKCWSLDIRRSLLELSFEAITPPRNRYLYQAHFWPLSDLIIDGAASEFDTLFGAELDPSQEGFLLRLCFSIYYLFEQLMCDLARDSVTIQLQVSGSRVLKNAGSPVLDSYGNFVSQISTT
jgi:hypothetical protein